LFSSAFFKRKLMGSAVICFVRDFMSDNIIFKETVRKHFDYRDDGELIWKYCRGGVAMGEVAGSVRPNGYKDIRFYGKLWRAHRLIFIWHHGWVPDYLDHIDRNPLNNRIENLRPATLQQNVHNASIHKNNTSGFKGIFWSKERNRWAARCRVNYKSYYVGNFKDINDAVAALHEFRKKHHGEFSCNG